MFTRSVQAEAEQLLSKEAGEKMVIPGKVLVLTGDVLSTPETAGFSG